MIYERFVRYSLPYSPGVDDGAKDMDMALSMIEKEIDAGVETIILTPHFRKEMFEPDMEDIWERV